MREIYKSLSRAPLRVARIAPPSSPASSSADASADARKGRTSFRARPSACPIDQSIDRAHRSRASIARAHPSIARIDRAMRAHRSARRGTPPPGHDSPMRCFVCARLRTAGPPDRRTRGRRFWRERARAFSDSAMAIFVRACVVDFVCASSARAGRGSRFAVDGWLDARPSARWMDVEDRFVCHQCARARSAPPRRRVARCARTAEYAPSRAIVVASDARHRWIASLDRSLARSIAREDIFVRAHGRTTTMFGRSDVLSSSSSSRGAVPSTDDDVDGRRRTNGGAPRVDETRARCGDA